MLWPPILWRLEHNLLDILRECHVSARLEHISIEYIEPVHVCSLIEGTLRCQIPYQCFVNQLIAFCSYEILIKKRITYKVYKTERLLFFIAVLAWYINIYLFLMKNVKQTEKTYKF